MNFSSFSRRSGRSRNAAMGFIFISSVLDVMAMGIVIPVLPTLIEEFAGSNAQAGVINGGFVALWALMQFVASPIIGSLSDRFGRRPVILLSTAGLGLDYVLMALAPNLWWLALGRMIAGVTSSSFTASYAYMADITPPDKRARGYGLIGAAFSGGFVLGPLLGGVLGEWGPRVPFLGAAALSLAAFLYGVVVLPESLPPEKRSPFRWKNANPVGAMALLRKTSELAGLAVVNFLLYFAHHVFSAVFVLYAAHRYDWSSFEVGALLAVVGTLDMLVQGTLVGPLTRRFGEPRTLIFGLVCGSVGMALFGVASTGLMFALAAVPNALWALAQPTLQSLMTQHVPDTEQGQLQGANMSVASIAGIGSPMFFGWVYSRSIGEAAWFEHPGLAFLLAAVVLFSGALLGAMVVRRRRLAVPAVSGP